MAIPRLPLVTWQELIDEASEQTGYHCDEGVEHYLALTLDRFSTDKNLASVVIALDFLLAINCLGREGGGKIRKVGDECLLIAGLFPERAEKKHVPLEYFIGMGQEAYHQLTHAHFKFLYDQALFAKLSKEFPKLIDLLHTMRKIPKKPLQ
jgi:hypothetical protein